MDTLLSVIIVVLIGIVGAQQLYIKQLKKRPDFAVFKELQSRANKSEKAQESIRQAFDKYRQSNGQDRLILDSKEALDADALMLVLRSILVEGYGAAGDESNMEKLVVAIYGDVEDYPPQLNQYRYANSTKLALWSGKSRMSKELDKLIWRD